MLGIKHNQMKVENKAAVLGVDLGGTNMRAGKVVGGTVEALEKNLLPQAKAEQEVIDLLIQTIAAVFEPSVRAIGVGVPSLLDRNKGIVYTVQNIPSWKEVHLKDILENRFQVPVFADNDANCFALGEKVFGAGEPYEDFVGLSLGTGLGCGIIKNGKLMQDANACSGEFGSLFYQDSILEDYCSGKFFTNHYKESGANIFKKAQDGDPKALEAYREFGLHLGKAIQMILFSVDPAAIVLGGSIASAYEYFAESMHQTLNEFPYQNVIDKLQIVKATNSDAGVLGAASLCFDHVSQR